ncbi:MAG: pyruvate dehydrogenase (acetyl-transferring) E1 component subunit alpha [Pseudomonadota bacterium]
MPHRELAHFNVQHLQILDEHGELDAALDPHLDDATALRLYRVMLLAREADQRMLKLQRQGRLGTFPLCTGQEAASVAPALAMAPDDWFVGAFRELGGRLARGEPLSNYMAYYNGWEEGNVQPEAARRVLPIAVVVGSQLLHAVGLAQAMRLKNEKSAVVSFVGDGGTSEGDFHEALNFASVWSAPVVFVVQNNGWAISMPRAKQMHSQTIAQKAIAYDMPGLQVDGNDALAMYAATREALERAREGKGPTLIEAVTYRLLQHTTADDPSKYRADDEVQAWWPRDPIPRFFTYLKRRGLWDEARQAALEEELRLEIEQAVQVYEAMQGLKPDAPFDHVWAKPSAELERQRRSFLDNLQRDHEVSHG